METDFISYAQENVNNATMISGGDERWSKVFWNQFPQEQPKQMCGCTPSSVRGHRACAAASFWLDTSNSKPLTRTHHHLLTCLIPQYGNAKTTWLHHSDTAGKSYTLDVLSCINIKDFPLGKHSLSVAE